MLSSVALRADQHSYAEGVHEHPYGRFVRGFDRLYARFEERYRGALSWALEHPAIVLGGAFGLLALTVVALRLGVVKTEVFPASDSRYVRLEIRTPNGTALSVTDHASQLVEAALAHDPRVLTVGAGIGTSNPGFGRALSNEAQIQATLRPGVEGPKATAFINDWQRLLSPSPAAGSGRAAAGMSRIVRDMPPDQVARVAAARNAVTGSEVRGRTIDIVQGTVTQGADALQIQLFGPDYNELYRLAQSVIPTLAQIPGVVRPDTNVTPTQPEVDVKIDRRRAAELGFSTGDIAYQIATATSGTIASYYQENGIQYPILVELPPAQRRTLDSIDGLQLIPPTAQSGVSSSAAVGVTLNGTAPPGGSTVTTSDNTSAPSSTSAATVPLSAVADVHTGVGPSQISRQDKQRRIDITAPVLSVPLGSVVAASEKIMNGLTLPSGYRWQFGPAITQNNDTFSNLALVVLLAIALIYMLLAAQFESYLDPLVIMVSVPLSVVGIIGSLMLTHRSFGLTAFIGSLMLVGIAVKNAILVVEFTKQLRRSGMDAREALMHAGPRRLRPILMTTLATMGGMLPLALGIEAGSSTQAPLGTVVIGGLITSTMLSLLVVPTLYLWVARRVEPHFNPKPPIHPIEAGFRMPEREPAGVYK
jgi:hydrophobic/amphiphilic exporter-1 (mainly G- bacteria), HAE1 family